MLGGVGGEGGEELGIESSCKARSYLFLYCGILIGPRTAG